MTFGFCYSYYEKTKRIIVKGEKDGVLEDAGGARRGKAAPVPSWLTKLRAWPQPGVEPGAVCRDS